MAKPSIESSFLSAGVTRRTGNEPRDIPAPLSSGVTAAPFAPSAADLLASEVSNYVIPLRPAWREIFNDLFALGHVRLLTSGASAFMEKHGVYPMPEFSGSTAVFFGDRMELTARTEALGRGFAVFPADDGSAGFSEYGLHFFSRSGASMHRAFLLPSGSVEAFEWIAEEYRHHHGSSLFFQTSQHSRLRSSRDGREPVAGPKGVDGSSARRVESHEVLRILHHSQQYALPIRISVGSESCWQTHIGILKEIQSSASSTCARDGDTAMYLRDADLAETWIVERPVEDGRLMSLQAFDRQGELMVTMRGGNLANEASDHRWNHLLEGLSDL